MIPTLPQENMPLSKNTKTIGRPCVIIPGYNIAQTIGGIIKDITQRGIEVIFIDDGSKDQTRKAVSESKAIVLTNEINKGKGASLRKGFDYALKQGYDILITMDGDGQHSPKDIPNFLNALKLSPDHDIIIGDRMHNPSGMPALRWLTNKAMSKIISYISRQDIPDSQSGFRLIKSACLRNLRLNSKRFEIESEIIIEAAGKNYKITSIPIRTIYDNNNSQIRPVRDTIKFIKFLLAYAGFYFLKKSDGKKSTGT